MFCHVDTFISALCRLSIINIIMIIFFFINPFPHKEIEGVGVGVSLFRAKAFEKLGGCLTFSVPNVWNFTK